MITMCPRSESHLTYMSSVTFTTEFHGGQVLSGHQLADDSRRRVHELGQSLRVGVLGEAPLTLEDQPVVLGDADGR